MPRQEILASITFWGPTWGRKPHSRVLRVGGPGVVIYGAARGPGNGELLKMSPENIWTFLSSGASGDLDVGGKGHVLGREGEEIQDPLP